MSKKHRQVRRQNFGYDQLESKELLATFVVNTIADNLMIDGQLSLREAVMAADTNAAVGDAGAGDLNGDQIRFDASLSGQTITLSGGELTITDDLMIHGESLGITIDANLTSRLFNVATTESVVIRDLNLTRGSTMDVGGSVLTTGSGQTVLNGVSISGSQADGIGGGAVATSIGQLAILNSDLSDNHATGVSGSGGGLLITSGQVTISNSSLTANSANRAGGGIEIIDGRLIFSGSSLGGADVNDGNIAGPAGTAAPGNGGGLHVTGMANTEVFILGQSTVENNFAASEGGGLWNQSGSVMVVNDSTVANNIASGADADTGGGGIFNNGGNVFVNRTLIDGNQADGMSGSGGGILSTAGLFAVKDSTVSANVANRAGGGAEVIDGSFLVTNSMFGGTAVSAGNIAGPAGTAAPGNGGALHVSGTSGTISSFTDSHVMNNVAAREGGGLWNQNGSTLIVNGSQIEQNVALGDAADDGGGGIFNNGGDVFVTATVVADNDATGAAGSGGGVFTTDGLVAINDSTISGNTANRAGGGIEIVDGTLLLNTSVLGGAQSADANVAGPAGSAMPGNGGGIHVSGTNGTFTGLSDTLVQNNQAAREGGGLWNQQGSTMAVRAGSVVMGNTASGDAADNGGGGIFNNGGNLNVLDAVIAENFADGTSGSGGGIFSTAGTVFVDDSTISGNVANRAGGGIEVIDGVLFLKDSMLGSLSADEGNIAGPAGTANPGNGGGLHVTGTNGTLTILDNLVVANNSAGNEGGGLWNQSGSTMVVRNGSIVASNDAGVGGGGGILNRGGSLNLVDSTVQRNQTTGNGGGVSSLVGGDTRIQRSDITRNDASDTGGGIYNESMVMASDVIISFNEAGMDGGGILTTPGATTNLTNSSLYGNSPNDQA